MGLKWEHMIHNQFQEILLLRTEVLYNFPTEFGVSVKLVGLIKTCLNETYSKVPTGKLLSVDFTIQDVQYYFRIRNYEIPRKSRLIGIHWDTPFSNTY